MPPPDAFVSRGIGRVAGVAAALVALLSYTFLQVGLYGALGPTAENLAAAHLGVHAAWWRWALGAWAVITVLGLLRVDITGRVLGVLLSAEILVIVAEAVLGLAHPAGGDLSLATLSPADLTSAGFGTFAVLAVVAVLGFVGFEQAPVLAEEARNARRTIPLATFFALGMIAIVYAGASWAMAAHNGTSHVAAAAGQQGPGLLFGLGGSGSLAQAAQWLFLTSLFAAAGGRGHAQPGRGRRLPRPGAIPVADRRPGYPAQGLPRILPAVCRARDDPRRGPDHERPHRGRPVDPRRRRRTGPAGGLRRAAPRSYRPMDRPVRGLRRGPRRAPPDRHPAPPPGPPGRAAGPAGQGHRHRAAALIPRDARQRPGRVRLPGGQRPVHAPDLPAPRLRRPRPADPAARRPPHVPDVAGGQPRGP